MQAEPDLDRIDRKILSILQEDGRIANLKLAEAVALSPTAVLARVQQLQGALIPADVDVAVTRNYGETAAQKASQLMQKLAFATASVILLVGLALYAAIRLIAASARLGKSVTELRGAMPPLIVSVCEYAVPAVPAGSVAGVSVSATKPDSTTAIATVTANCRYSCPAMPPRTNSSRSSGGSTPIRRSTASSCSCRCRATSTTRR